MTAAFLQKARFHKLLAALLCLGICCLPLCSCSSQKTEVDNLFSHAVKVTDSTIAPAQADFGQSVEEVLKAVGLSEEDRAVDYTEEAPTYAHTLKVPSLPGEVEESFDFDGDQLVMVSYTLILPKDETQSVAQTLHDQAAEVLPDELLRGEDQILNGGPTYWEDEANNVVCVLFPITSSEEEQAVLVEVWMGRETNGLLQPR